MSVHLNDAAIEILCEWWHAGHLVIRHGDDYVVGFETLLSGDHNKAITFLPQTIDTNAVLYGQSEAPRVLHKVIGHLVFRRESVAAARKAKAWKPCVSRRVEEAERVPAVPPRVTDMQTRI